MVNDRRVIVTGRFSMREDKPNSVFIEDIVPLIKGGEKLLVLEFIPQTEPLQQRVVEIMRRFPGNRDVYFVFPATGRKLRASKELRVNLSKDLLAELAALLGENRVRVVPKKQPAQSN